jgi:hypothetical protein
VRRRPTCLREDERRWRRARLLTVGSGGGRAMRSRLQRRRQRRRRQAQRTRGGGTGTERELGQGERKRRSKAEVEVPADRCGPTKSNKENFPVSPYRIYNSNCGRLLSVSSSAVIVFMMAGIFAFVLVSKPISGCLFGTTFYMWTPVTFISSMYRYTQCPLKGKRNKKTKEKKRCIGMDSKRALSRKGKKNRCAQNHYII